MAHENARNIKGDLADGDVAAGVAGGGAGSGWEAVESSLRHAVSLRYVSKGGRGRSKYAEELSDALRGLEEARCVMPSCLAFGGVEVFGARMLPAFFSRPRSLYPPRRPSLTLRSSSLAWFGRDAANMESLGAQHVSLAEQAVLLVQVRWTLAKTPGEKGRVWTRSPGGWYHNLLLYLHTQPPVVIENVHNAGRIGRPRRRTEGKQDVIRPILLLALAFCALTKHPFCYGATFIPWRLLFSTLYAKPLEHLMVMPVIFAHCGHHLLRAPTGIFPVPTCSFSLLRCGQGAAE